MKVLVANVGSTSFKYQLLDMTTEALLAKGGLERIGADLSPMRHQTTGKDEVRTEVSAPTHNAAIEHALAALLDRDTGALSDLSEVRAVGFKTVHAGKITGCVLLNDEVLQAMEEFSLVVPGHNPPYINAVRIFRDLMPDTPLVGVFEPHFHWSLPPKAFTYGMPYDWYQRFGIRRLGFHGASHRYIAERTPQLLGVPAEKLKLISCHLGGSSSLCAISGGKSVDTSMGFSAQSGVLMSNRTGDLDAFVIPFLLERGGLALSEITAALTKNGGMLGISGVSGDMRDLEEAAAAGNERSQLAIDVYVYGVKKYIGAYVVAMNGLDALVFTGGIGEKGAATRAAVCADMDYLGIALDEDANAATVGKEGVISPVTARVKVMVVPTNEELVVARETVRVVQGAA